MRSGPWHGRPVAVCAPSGLRCAARPARGWPEPQPADPPPRRLSLPPLDGPPRGGSAPAPGCPGRPRERRYGGRVRRPRPGPGPGPRRRPGCGVMYGEPDHAGRRPGAGAGRVTRECSGGAGSSAGRPGRSVGRPSIRSRSVTSSRAFACRRCSRRMPTSALMTRSLARASSPKLTTRWSRTSPVAAASATSKPPIACNASMTCADSCRAVASFLASAAVSSLAMASATVPCSPPSFRPRAFLMASLMSSESRLTPTPPTTVPSAFTTPGPPGPNVAASGANADPASRPSTMSGGELRSAPAFAATIALIERRARFRISPRDGSNWLPRHDSPFVATGWSAYAKPARPNRQSASLRRCPGGPNPPASPGGAGCPSQRARAQRRSAMAGRSQSWDPRSFP